MTLWLAAPSPAPSPTPVEMTPWTVSPGVQGFLFGFFLLALACIPLYLSMSRHMRKVDRNRRVLEAEAADQAAAGPEGATTAGGGTGRAGASPAAGTEVDDAGPRGGR